MNHLLEVIYQNYAEKPLTENQLETPEIRNVTLSFFDTYFSYMSNKEQEKAYNRLIELCNTIEENAFEVGFRTGIKLLTGGMQS